MLCGADTRIEDRRAHLLHEGEEHGGLDPLFGFDDRDGAEHGVIAPRILAFHIGRLHLDAPRQAFWQVTFPLSLPGVAAGALLCFIPIVGEFVVKTALPLTRFVAA